MKQLSVRVTSILGFSQISEWLWTCSIVSLSVRICLLGRLNWNIRRTCDNSAEHSSLWTSLSDGWSARTLCFLPVPGAHCWTMAHLQWPSRFLSLSSASVLPVVLNNYLDWNYTRFHCAAQSSSPFSIYTKDVQIVTDWWSTETIQLQVLKLLFNVMYSAVTTVMFHCFRMQRHQANQQIGTNDVLAKYFTYKQ